MSDTLRDGTGKNYEARVDGNNRLHAFVTNQSEPAHATVEGRAYNINTGPISLTTGESAVFYFKNEENYDFIIDSVVVGLSSGTPSDTPELYIVDNPTAGDIITSATNVDMNRNRNLGSATTLRTATLAYKGADGNSFSNGANLGLVYLNTNGRTSFPFDLVMPKGTAIGFTVDPKASLTCYVAIVGFIQDEVIA